MNDDAQRHRCNDADASGSAPPGRASGSLFDERGHVPDELLAGAIDGPLDLSPADRQALDAHLAACADCRATLADLQVIARSMRTLPLMETPRSFILTPAMVGARSLAPVSSSRRGVWSWLDDRLGALRWATAFAAVLLVLVVAVDALNGPATRGDDAGVAGSVAQPYAADGGPVGGAAEATATQATMSMQAPAARNTGPTEATTAAAVAASATPASGAAGALAQTPAAQEQDAARTEELAARDSLPRPTTTAGQRDWPLVLETGLALLIAWLLAALVAIPRLARSREIRAP